MRADLNNTTSDVYSNCMYYDQRPFMVCNVAYLIPYDDTCIFGGSVFCILTSIPASSNDRRISLHE